MSYFIFNPETRLNYFTSILSLYLDPYNSFRISWNDKMFLKQPLNIVIATYPCQLGYRNHTPIVQPSNYLYVVMKAFIYIVNIYHLFTIGK